MPRQHFMKHIDLELNMKCFKIFNAKYQVHVRKFTRNNFLFNAVTVNK